MRGKNPYQDDHGNKDFTITRHEGESHLEPAEGLDNSISPAPGQPFLIGETMTGGYGRVDRELAAVLRERSRSRYRRG